MNNLIVWDALIAWRDDLLERNVMRISKMNYLSNMVQLIEKRVVDLEQPLSDFMENGVTEGLQIINSTHDWSLSTRLYRSNLLRLFQRFIQRTKITSTYIIIPFKEFRSLEKIAISEILSSCEDKAKSQSLTFEDIVSFLDEIRISNERDFLICWMMWELKATIHQILDLTIKDINFSERSISFKDEIRIGDLRDDLKQRIIEQSDGKEPSDLLFSTDQGRRIHAGQLARCMRKASRKVNLPILITPKILYAHSKVYAEKAFREMSVEAKENLYAKFDEIYACAGKAENNLRENEKGFKNRCLD